jgi:hypothetical protein
MPRRYGITPASALQQAQREQAPLENQSFCPLPAPTGSPPFRLSTSELEIPPADGARVLHVIGDCGGVLDPDPQSDVAAALVAELDNPPAAGAASLLYIVGDVVYFNGDESQYGPQFYEPYAKYNRPIVAIPGNHDGDNSDDPSVPSLSGFVENFCSTTPHLDPEAEETNRDTMTLPNVYWTLSDPLVTIVGLYTNVPAGGVVEPDQAAWLAGELKAAPSDAALIVTLHHPPYSCDVMHGGSAGMGRLLDQAFAIAARQPQLVLSGHVHNYQRFTRSLGAQQLPYVVIGNGGYHNLHEMAPGAVAGLAVTADTKLEAWCDDQWGYLRLEIGADAINGEFVAVAKDGTVTPRSDTFTITV